MRAFDSKPLFLGSWWSECHFKSPPVWRGIGTENFRKGPVEGIREGPLRGTLSFCSLPWVKQGAFFVPLQAPPSTRKWRIFLTLPV